MSNEKKGAGSSTATKSRWKKVDKFFPVVVDNFFEDPMAIVELGKKLPNEVVGRQPGKRSKQLWEVDDVLHNAILRKILSCYYDLDYVSLSWATSNLSFHTIEHFSDTKGCIKNKGWVHQDVEVFGNDEVAGLIYLTPDIDQDSGTSLWTLKPDVRINTQAPAYFDQQYQVWINEDGSYDTEEYTKGYKIHMDKFEEKLRFQNVFNRMIMYDTKEWHAANSYYHGPGQDARLTLAFFIGGIEGGMDFPLHRVQDPEFDSLIGDRIQQGTYI